MRSSPGFARGRLHDVHHRLRLRLVHEHVGAVRLRHEVRETGAVSPLTTTDRPP